MTAPMLGMASGNERTVIDITQYFEIIEIMKTKEAIGSLSALASESRLSVFRLLIKRGPEGYTPSELSARLDIPAPTLSFHLRELAHAELVTSRREGRNLFYSPNLIRMNALIGYLTDNCCSLASGACDADCRPIAAAAIRKRA